ncbi:HAD domain-containing protein [Streptomyces cellulosae]|uniref:HAD domain-containing protein n=1 Tax=Streptomyces cellulosae TaxID=1968 RepID=UPI002251280E|nr:HAD domain-containing protein [Streptomyces cellulosae]WTB83891.1 HAD domain-containing protein [Streptomyces cellulosae]WTB90735.1 HAD domain-containing protein [Streptomyces cellulosae]WTC58087.1 HAD domain-containing protein [Streptomyces cellulosae]
MSAATERPLLFLDVDGPLIPFGAPHPPPPAATADDGNPLLARLDPALGARLLALGCSLVWATTWREEANDVVAPRLGLPRLPVLDWPEADEPGPRGLHWKTRPLVEWAGGRPFVWVDDEIGAVDRQWVAAAHPGPALLHRVDPARGLQDSDFRALTDWLAALGRPS